MFERRVEFVAGATLSFVLMMSLAACGEGDTFSKKGQIESESSLFDTMLNFATFGDADIKADGNSISVTMRGGESGIAISLKPSITTNTVVTFSIDAPAPLNLRLTKADGSIDYMSTESRGHVVLGPTAAVEALVYGTSAGALTFTAGTAETCGGSLLCSPDGSVAVRIGPVGGTSTLIAQAYGASGLSHPDSNSIAALRGGPAGEYGFTLARETEGGEALILEFEAKAEHPVNLLVQSGDKKDYISSNAGWILLLPGSSALAYTPVSGSFALQNMIASVCTPDEPRCGAALSEPEPASLP